MNDQEQDAAGNATAIQSGRDTNIQQGLSAEDVREIIKAISGQLPAYAAMAREVVNERLEDFENRIMERFVSAENLGFESFKDPDFQYLVREAQHAYARSDEEGVHDILVDLIAQRSKQTHRNRLTLSLNEAVKKSSVLTINEFAELSLTLLLKRTIKYSVRDLESLVEFLQIFALPLIPYISEEHASYSYLEAQGCAAVSIGESKLDQVMKEKYGGVMSNGFEPQDLINILPADQKTALDNAGCVVPCLNNSHKLQLDALRKDDFQQTASSSGLSEGQITNVWNMFSKTMWSENEMRKSLKPYFPEIDELFRLWNNTPLKNLGLTSVGIAIGHANLANVSNMDADLSIWIK